MPQFGEDSRLQLSTTHPKLQRILMAAIKAVDFSILEGFRSKDKQEKLFNEGKSKVLDGKHNKYPSEAVDIAPYPYPKTTEELHQVYYLAGIIKGMAELMGIKTRMGADWNRNNDMRDDKFQDAWHVELEDSEV